MWTWEIRQQTPPHWHLPSLPQQQQETGRSKSPKLNAATPEGDNALKYPHKIDSIWFHKTTVDEFFSSIDKGHQMGVCSTSPPTLEEFQLSTSCLPQRVIWLTKSKSFVFQF